MRLYRIPSDGFATLPRQICPVCGSIQKRFAFIKYGDSYYTCMECNSLYLGKIPTPEKIKECYAQIGVYSQLPQMRHFSRETIPEYWQTYFQVVEKIKQSSGWKHLDIGCGVGECLLAASYLGWEGVGVEVGESAVEFVRIELGLKALNSTLENANFPENTFDLVTVNAVLEHVVDPLSVCLEATRVLRHGGVLVIVVPTTEFLGYRLFGKIWHMIHSAHLQYFSKPGLFIMLQQAGIQPKLSYTLGRGAQGSRLMMNLIRTDIAWTLFSYLTGHKHNGWIREEPIGWFSAPERVQEDPRLSMRYRADDLVKKSRWLWDGLGFPIHWLTKCLDRQQSIIIFGVK